MIHSIEIKNLKKSKFEYIKNGDLDKIQILANTKIIKFKKGLNLIIGENGCGKSTLINMLSFYTFCNSGESELLLELGENSINKFFNINSMPYDGINIKNDYRLKVSKLILNDYRSSDDVLRSIGNFSNFYNSRDLSEGEKLLFSIRNTFDRMFSSDLVFDHSALKSVKVNDIWQGYQDKIKEYILFNQVNETNQIFTLLMDEPDRNLDINNIKQIYDILSNQKENGQMIVSIHNPLLINSLSKLKNINIIELTKGYKDNVINIVNGLS